MCEVKHFRLHGVIVVLEKMSLSLGQYSKASVSYFPVETARSVNRSLVMLLRLNPIQSYATLFKGQQHATLLGPTCCIRLHGTTTMLALVAYSLKPVKLLSPCKQTHPLPSRVWTVLSVVFRTKTQCNKLIEHR